MKTKLFIYSFLITVIYSCKSTEEAIQIEQVKSEYPILLIGDTIEEGRIFRIGYPLQFKVKNNSFKERKLIGTYYYYDNSKTGFSYSSGWKTPGSLLYKIQENGELVRDNSKDIYNKFETKGYIIYTGHSLDTSKVYKDMFNPHLEQMKELRQEKIHIETIKEFEEKFPGFIKGFLQGDSVQFKFKNNKAGDSFFLPVKYEELYTDN